MKILQRSNLSMVSLVLDRPDTGAETQKFELMSASMSEANCCAIYMPSYRKPPLDHNASAKIAGAMTQMGVKTRIIALLQDGMSPNKAWDLVVSLPDSFAYHLGYGNNVEILSPGDFEELVDFLTASSQGKLNAGCLCIMSRELPDGAIELLSRALKSKGLNPKVIDKDLNLFDVA